MPIIDGPDPDGRRKDSHSCLGRKLLWFIVLWVGGLTATAGLAYGMRSLLGL